MSHKIADTSRMATPSSEKEIRQREYYENLCKWIRHEGLHPHPESLPLRKLEQIEKQWKTDNLYD